MSRRGSRVTPHDESTHHGHTTTIGMEYEMWVIPTYEFLKLSVLLTHEELRAKGTIVRVDDSMQRIFYISHQWTSSREPDHSTAQLHTFQSILLRMLRGTHPETSPTYADAIRLPQNVNIKPDQWRRLVQDSFLWIDFVSVVCRTMCCLPRSTYRQLPLLSVHNSVCATDTSSAS